MGKINEIDHYFMNLFIPEFFPIFTYIIPKPILDYLTDYRCLIKEFILIFLSKWRDNQYYKRNNEQIDGIFNKRNRLICKAMSNSQSLDFTPTFFFLWEYLKGEVFENNPNSFEDLKNLTLNERILSIKKHTLGKEFEKVCQGFQDLIKPFIDEHLKTLNPSDPRDLMDDYVTEMKEGKSEDYSHFDYAGKEDYSHFDYAGTEDYSHFDYSDLTRITFDLFVAGNDTTSNMTQWFLNYMARFQDVQEKIQKEIDRVVPRGTLPGLQHRNELAYLDATINEVQRHCSMAPLGVFRSTTSEVKIDGYDIPKGTIVMSVAGLSHRNPVYFKDPDKFDPSRFLDKNGKFISTCDGFQAFGIGKRQCLGEQFARMELYLITAALMQNFKFGPPDGEGPMSIEADVVPVTHMPRKEQKYSIQYRN
ncbi:cytochrome P450 2L1 [Armadillidium vulgare]|nr:cytochrome P450 2L1 [Armadillidium vulgare]